MVTRTMSPLEERGTALLDHMNVIGKRPRKCHSAKTAVFVVVESAPVLSRRRSACRGSALGYFVGRLHASVSTTGRDIIVEVWITTGMSPALLLQNVLYCARGAPVVNLKLDTLLPLAAHSQRLMLTLVQPKTPTSRASP